MTNGQDKGKHSGNDEENETSTSETTKETNKLEKNERSQVRTAEQEQNMNELLTRRRKRMNGVS